MNKIHETLRTAAHLILALAMVFGVFLYAGTLDRDVQEMGTATIFTSVTATDDISVGDDLSVTGDAAVTGALTLTGAPTIGGALTLNDNATIDGTLAVTGASTLSNDVTLSESIIFASTAFTPTAGQELTVDAGYYVINSSGNVSMTLATTGAVTGQIVILYGDDANTVTINDTNVLTSSGSALSLGQYDVVAFLWNGAKWVELFLLANS